MSTFSSRFIAIGKRVQEIPDTTDPKVAWCIVFDLDSTLDPEEIEPLISECLVAMSREVDEMRIRLNVNAKAKFEVLSKRIKRALLPSSLARSWGTTRAQFPNDVLREIELFELLLSDEREDMGQAEYQQGLTLISDLEQFILKSELPNELRYHLIKIVNQLRVALAIFSINASAPQLHTALLEIDNYVTTFTKAVDKNDQFSETSDGKNFKSITSRLISMLKATLQWTKITGDSAHYLYDWSIQADHGIQQALQYIHLIK